MNIGPNNEHVLVLAAGKGVRMGGPKATMVVDGRVWWEVQAERLARVGRPCTWVVNKTVHRAIGKKPLAPERIVIADANGTMMDSVLAALGSLPAGGNGRGAGLQRGVFVLPVDVPVARPDVFDALAARDRPAIPTHQGRRGHPLYLPWPWVQRHLLPSVGQPRHGLMRLDFMIAPDATLVEVSDPAVVVNLNTPDQLEKASNILFAMSRRRDASNDEGGGRPG